MKIGDKVMFKNDIYELLFIYKSGYCEIKDKDGIQFLLLPLDQIKKI